MVKVVVGAVLGLLMLVSQSRATEITLFFINSGGAIDDLLIQDLICNQPRYDSQFAANDAKQVDHFCVTDATRLVTDIKIYHNGIEKYSLQDVPANSNIDVFTGNVNSP
jgi:hypothetical protein